MRSSPAHRGRPTRRHRGTPSSSTHPTGSAYVYLLRCRDRTFYTGWTIDLDARIARHQGGTGARYTRSRLPVEVIYVERLPDRRQARRREWTLRRLSHQQKASLAGRVGRPRSGQGPFESATGTEPWARPAEGCSNAAGAGVPLKSIQRTSRPTSNRQ